MNTKTKQGIVLTIAMLSYFLTSLSNSLVLTGLTKIASDLHIDQVGLSWVQNAYGLAFGSFLLMAGRLSDEFNRRLILNTALIIFMVGSLLSGIAGNGSIMIGARFLQGIGSALLAPTSMALLIDYFDGPALVSAIAWYSSVAGLGASVGLVVGGVFASYFTWRFGFFLNVPLCLLMLFLSALVLEGRQKTDHAALDVVGSVSSIIGCGLLVLSLNGARHPIVTFAVAIVIIAYFIIHEAHSKNPIMPLQIFASWTRSNGYLSRALVNGAVLGYWFYISEYLQEVMHYSPFAVGLGYLPLSLTMFFGAMVVPRLINSLGNQRTLIVAVAIELAGFLWALFSLGGHYWTGVGIPMLIIGLGQGLALAPLTNMGIDRVDADRTGTASGLVNTAHQLGGVIGLALMVSLASNFFHCHRIADQFHNALVVAIVMVAIVLLLAFTVRETPER